MSLIYRVIFEVIISRVAKLIGKLIADYKEKQHRKQLIKDNMAQAAIVKAISDEIKKLKAQGKPVPAELKERLRVESRKLINTSFD